MEKELISLPMTVYDLAYRIFQTTMEKELIPISMTDGRTLYSRPESFDFLIEQRYKAIRRSEIMFNGFDSNPHHYIDEARKEIESIESEYGFRFTGNIDPLDVVKLRLNSGLKGCEFVEELKKNPKFVNGIELTPFATSGNTGQPMKNDIDYENLSKQIFDLADMLEGYGLIPEARQLIDRILHNPNDPHKPGVIQQTFTELIRTGSNDLQLKGLFRAAAQLLGQLMLDDYKGKKPIELESEIKQLRNIANNIYPTQEEGQGITEGKVIGKAGRPNEYTPEKLDKIEKRLSEMRSFQKNGRPLSESKIWGMIAKDMFPGSMWESVRRQVYRKRPHLKKRK